MPDRFEQLVDEGRRASRTGSPRAGRSTLRDALALWRGPALADFAYESFAQDEIARLEEAARGALEDTDRRRPRARSPRRARW